MTDTYGAGMAAQAMPKTIATTRALLDEGCSPADIEAVLVHSMTAHGAGIAEATIRAGLVIHGATYREGVA